MIGFSLMELLIALCILGILSVISFASYSSYFVTAKRQEAIITLNQVAAALEQYAVTHESYQGATLSKLGFPEIVAHDQYQLALNTLTNNAYTIEATPLASQAKRDSHCGTLSLTSSGIKGISGDGKLETCW